MKNVCLSIVFILLLSSSFFGCGSCSLENINNTPTDNSVEENKDIKLTLENYDYYLSIRFVYKDSAIRNGGGWRCYFYDVYISGSIPGLYKDCSLTLENGYVINLDASGGAQTSKTIINDKDSFVVVEVSGTITPYY